MLENIKRRLAEGWSDGLTREEERRRGLCCLLFTFLWGLIAHAYGFLSGAFSHDVLNALYADGVENYWKLQLGRFLVVLYRRTVRCAVTMPWLIGLLALLWIGLAVWLMAKLFRARSPWLLCLLAGICTVNLTVIALTGTYLYELDADMLALLLAVAAAFLWDRFGWAGSALGLFFVAGTLSLYQSYLSVTVTLLILCSLLALLRSERFGAVFGKGLRGIGMLLLGGLLYFLLLKLLAARGISTDTGSYNSVSQAFQGGTGLLSGLAAVYGELAASFFDPGAAFLGGGLRVLNLLLAGLGAVLLLRALLHRGMGPAEKLLFLALVLLLPLGANLTRLLGAQVHDLMKYAFWLLYLLPLLLAFHAAQSGTAGKAARALAALLAALLLWSNTQTANALYVKKDLEASATLSLMTRVLSAVEQNPDYVPGETPLAFVGVSEQLNDAVYGFADYGRITGAESGSAIPAAHAEYYYNAYAAYFRYILNNPAVFCPHDKWNALQGDPAVAALPCYPDPGCMQLTDGVLVVKLGEDSPW